MSRDENGRRLSVSPTALATIVATCLGVGSGGAFAVKAARTASADENVMKEVLDEQRQLHQRIDVRLGTVENDAAANTERDKSVQRQLDELKTSLNSIDKKLDRALDQRRR